jgi:hypothetical protein
MINGIYTLANDVVFDQLVALLNSIEANVGKEIPVCVIPYDNNLTKVRAEIDTRDNVTLFNDTASIAYWEDFVTKAWKAHARAQKAWREKGMAEVHCLKMHRKLCSFDGPFEKFIYFDADTLSMGPLESVYQKLDEYDWVANDFQYKSDHKFVFDCPEEQLLQVFDSSEPNAHIFCAGWFASKKGVFDQVKLEKLLEQLKSGEADVMALWWADQSLFNYMVWRSNISFYNFAYHDLDQATGSHCDSKFDLVDHVLYDKGRRLTYLHYLSIPSSKFTKICAGEDVDIPYQDLFLHYRYLKSPDQRPKQLVRPSFLVRAQRATNSFINKKVGNMKQKLRKLKT